MARPFNPGKLETYLDHEIRGRGTYRRYVSVITPDGKRPGVFSTLRAAKAYIKKQQELFRAPS